MLITTISGIHRKKAVKTTTDNASNFSKAFKVFRFNVSELLSRGRVGVPDDGDGSSQLQPECFLSPQLVGVILTSFLISLYLCSLISSVQPTLSLFFCN